MPLPLPRSLAPVLRRVACAAGAALACATAGAAPAHEHGVARLDVAVDATRVVLMLDTPLDNLLGFERAPRTEAERQRAQAAIARLREAGRLFRIDPAAGCSPGPVAIRSPALGLGAAEAGAAADHADLEAEYSFSCTAAARAAFVEVGLFEAFAGFRRIEVQLATPRGQGQATLRRPARRVELAR